MKHLRDFNEAYINRCTEEMKDIINVISDEYPTDMRNLPDDRKNNEHRFVIKRCSGTVEQNPEDIQTYGTEEHFMDLLEQVVNRLINEDYRFTLLLGILCDIPGVISKRSKTSRMLKMEEWIFRPNGVRSEQSDRSDWKDYKENLVVGGADGVTTEIRGVVIIIRGESK